LKVGLLSTIKTSHAGVTGRQPMQTQTGLPFSSQLFSQSQSIAPDKVGKRRNPKTNARLTPRNHPRRC